MSAHDVRDRRHTNMEGAIKALQGCSADLVAYAGDEGIALLVADRIDRLTAELSLFRARDLLNARAVQS